ncbi:hypothetical protein QOZ80_4BG0338870 [Eleusine coracana subsp. coracana]|nr:hypothetical protein QOZ80_4BG0338870 [Eleusine coracana subsp. coracana]
MWRAAHGTEECTDERMKQTITAVLKLTGFGVTMLPYVLPFVIAWGTGNLQHTLKLYSEFNLMCTGLSSYGWLMYSVVQVSYKDVEKVVGIDAIVINAISFAVSGFMLMIMLFCARQGKGKVCLVALFVHTAMILALVQFPVLRWVSKDDTEKFVVGIIAGIFQGLSELGPVINLMIMWLRAVPQGGYEQIRHYKKFIIISRGVDSVVTMYWMLYCVFTYQFDQFGWANILCAAMSVISFVAHCAWAVKP